MKLIALDTETTGLYSKTGDRIIELAMYEVTRSATPQVFHSYFNPQGRAISEEARAVHGITDAFLADKPTFAERFDEICSFIDGATLVIHNADFDLGFLEDEALDAGFAWPMTPVIDTLKLALHERPGKHNSLDALCSWQNIDTSIRTKHSALIDTQLLAELYLRWKGQATMDLTAAPKTRPSTAPALALNQLTIGISLPEDPPAPAWEKFMAGLKL